jgi:hypothetical protein
VADKNGNYCLEQGRRFPRLRLLTGGFVPFARIYEATLSQGPTLSDGDRIFITSSLILQKVVGQWQMLLDYVRAGFGAARREF